MNPPRPHGVSSLDGEHGQATRLAPAGFVDELGERSLSFDPISETIVETLRLRREFAESLAFDSALRARVDRVGRLSDPALAKIQSVERTDAGLLLVSKYASGRRLSELSAIDAGPGLAFDVIRRVIPALAELHQATPGSGHGALSLNRIVMTRDKRLIIVEHVLATALESLHWSRPRFNELGLVVADAVPVRLDERTDLRQLGWIVLSFLLGRSLSPADYPGLAQSLLDEALRTQSVMKTTKLGEWLGRALQLRSNGFATAEEAFAAFQEIAADPALEAAESDGALNAFPSETPATESPAPVVPIDRAKNLHAVPAPLPKRPPTPVVPTATKPATAASAVKPRRVWVSGNVTIWAFAGLLAFALAEALAIVALLIRPPLIVPARPLAENGPGGLPALTLIDGAPVEGNPATGFEPPAAPAVAPRPAPAPGPRTGSVNVIAAIDLEVLRDGAVVGSSTRPLYLPQGQYELVFANRTLGYRVTQVVNVTNGLATPVRIGIPNMLVSVNADPWADVTVDGVGYGQTPLANVSLAIGTHEFIFRHPELGERRQTVVVRADTRTLVTQNFR